MGLEVLEERGDVLELLVAVEAGQVHLVHRELADGHVVPEVGHLRRRELALGVAATVQAGAHETFNGAFEFQIDFVVRLRSMCKAIPLVLQSTVDGEIRLLLNGWFFCFTQMSNP